MQNRPIFCLGSRSPEFTDGKSYAITEKPIRIKLLTKTVSAICVLGACSPVRTLPMTVPRVLGTLGVTAPTVPSYSPHGEQCRLVSFTVITKMS